MYFARNVKGGVGQVTGICVYIACIWAPSSSHDALIAIGVQSTALMICYKLVTALNDSLFKSSSWKHNVGIKASRLFTFLFRNYYHEMPQLWS